MSAIADAIRRTRQAHMLLELAFNGLVKRYAASEISVPGASEQRHFNGAILDPIEIGSSFDFNSWTYSQPSVRIRIANKERIQDLEAVRRLDGGTGKIYVWAPGLTWEDIEPEGCLFQGAFEKESHDLTSYSFTLTSNLASRLSSLPGSVIDATTWGYLRLAGGAGSVAGQAQPLVFGSWTKGVPLLCIDTASFGYLACQGVPKSVDADYTAGSVDVHDKTGAVIAPAGVLFYPGILDGRGGVASVFFFTSDQTAAEPLSCGIEGLVDNSGDIVAVAGDLIEHPSDIIYWLLKNKSSLDAVDLGAWRTMRNLLPGLRFSTLIREESEGVDVMDRLLRQCLCSRIETGTGLGVVTQSIDAPVIGHVICDHHAVGDPVRISLTPASQVVNNLRANYAYNPTTGAYEGTILRNRTNDTACKLSAKDYGERPLYVLDLPDVQQEATALVLVNRLIQFRSHRHELAPITLPWQDGWRYREGDKALLTVPEGGSVDGSGWIEEPCLLAEKTFTSQGIRQMWWRIAV